MILRFKADNGGIYVLESVGGAGVRIVKWSDMRYSMEIFFDKICIRQLNFPNITKNHLQKLDKFQKETIGSEYCLNAEKLFRYKSFLDQDTFQEIEK